MITPESDLFVDFRDRTVSRNFPEIRGQGPIPVFRTNGTNGTKGTWGSQGFWR